MPSKECHICGLSESIFPAWEKFWEVTDWKNQQVWVCYGDMVNLDPMGDGHLQDPFTRKYQEGLYPPQTEREG
jgi:hypothetical protein